MGAIFLLIWLIPLVLVLISLAGIIWIWVRVLLGRRYRVTGDGLARCGNCSYPTRGVSDFVCPECGADLREYGIVTERQRKRPIGPLAFILTWSLCLPVPALIMAGILTAFGPKDSFQNQSVTLNPIHSGEYVSIDISHTPTQAYSWFNWLVPHGMGNQPMSLSLNGHSNNFTWVQLDPASMTYDPTFASYTVTTTSTTSTSATTTSNQPNIVAFDKAALLAWMKGGGVDVTKPEVIVEADELLQIIQNQPTAGISGLAPTQFTVGSHYSYSNDTPKGWWIIICLALVPLSWAGGIGLFFLVRGKQKPIHVDPPSADLQPQ